MTRRQVAVASAAWSRGKGRERLARQRLELRPRGEGGRSTPSTRPPLAPAWLPLAKPTPPTPPWRRAGRTRGVAFERGALLRPGGLAEVLGDDVRLLDGRLGEHRDEALVDLGEGRGGRVGAARGLLGRSLEERADERHLAVCESGRVDGWDGRGGGREGDGGKRRHTREFASRGFAKTAKPRDGGATRRRPPPPSSPSPPRRGLVFNDDPEDNLTP